MLGRTLRWQRVRTVCAAPAPSARCFCDAPAAPVASAADWVDPRGSYVAQRQAYKAEVSNLRKQYAAEVAAKREAKLKAHDAALQRIKESNTKSNVEAKAYGPVRWHSSPCRPLYFAALDMWFDSLHDMRRLKMAQNAERLREFQRQHAEYVALKVCPLPWAAGLTSASWFVCPYLLVSGLYSASSGGGEICRS